jgi:hypothetical protein
VAHASLIFASYQPSTTRTGSPTPVDASPADQRHRSRVLRYVLVNDACLKVDAYCATCRVRIGKTYVREIIGSRSTFCSFACYRCAAETPMLHPEGGREENLFTASQGHGETK